MRDMQLDGLAIYNGFLSGYRSIAAHRTYINSINVFPVPDGDTGNNMVRTLRSIASGLKPSRSAAAVLSRIASLSLRGARGNSGTILSQFLNGFSEFSADKPVLSIEDLGRTAHESVSFAYQAVDHPEEGTMLTVIKAWADTLYTESLHCVSINELLSRALKSARLALSRTPEQLAVLKENEVVDAGAWGFVSFLEGLSVLHEKGPVSLSFRKDLEVSEIPVFSDEAGSRHLHAPDKLEYRYCTELFMDKVAANPEHIKNHLRKHGDSLIISTGGNQARIHIHTSEPAEVVKICRRFGRIAEQKVDDMLRQSRDLDARPGQIAVLTDSIADIPLSVIDQHGIHVLNLNLLWGDEEFLDRLTITPAEFYRQQLIRRDFPGSATPDAERVVNLFRSILDRYEGLIVLPVAKALSGTWQLLNREAARFNLDRKRIHVVDTCLNSAAQGLLVVEIAKAAAGGAILDDLVSRAESMKKRIRIYVSVTTFRYMVRGGRLSPLKGLAATMLHLKPIVSLDESGRGIAFDKAFTRRGLLRKIEAIIRKAESNSGIERYVVVHASALERARQFSAVVERVLGTKPDFISEISPIVGMHSGKGAIAIGVVLAED